jgi:hypothetical protein
VVEPPIAHHVPQRSHRSRLGIPRTENEP